MPAGHRPSGTSTLTGMGVRSASASTAEASPPCTTAVGWMPRARSRSSASASSSSSAAASTAWPSSGSLAFAASTRSRSASVTSRCCAPSWRLRSIRSRSASDASMILERDARTSASWPCTVAASRRFSSASRVAAATERSSPGLASRPSSWMRTASSSPSASIRVIRRWRSGGPTSCPRTSTSCPSASGIARTSDGSPAARATASASSSSAGSAPSRTTRSPTDAWSMRARRTPAPSAMGTSIGRTLKMMAAGWSPTATSRTALPTVATAITPAAAHSGVSARRVDGDAFHQRWTRRTPTSAHRTPPSVAAVANAGRQVDPHVDAEGVRRADGRHAACRVELRHQPDAGEHDPCEGDDREHPVHAVLEPVAGIGEDEHAEAHEPQAGKRDPEVVEQRDGGRRQVADEEGEPGRVHEQADPHAGSRVPDHDADEQEAQADQRVRHQLELRGLGVRPPVRSREQLRADGDDERDRHERDHVDARQAVVRGEGSGRAEVRQRQHRGDAVGRGRRRGQATHPSNASIAAAERLAFWMNPFAPERATRSP